MLLIERAVSPVLFMVTFCGLLVVPRSWLPKFKLPGDTLAPGPVPVPLRGTVCGLVLASSVTVSVPVLVPEVVGVKVTSIRQLPRGKTKPSHRFISLFLTAKSPVVAVLLNVRVPSPVLVSVTN
jgi:hypothetical protein